MRTALLGIVMAATALIGWLDGPADAAFFAFFGLWGVLLVWSAGRAAVRDADSPSAEAGSTSELLDVGADLSITP